MKADGAINFIDHNFLWVSPIMARVAWAYLRNPLLPSLLVHINKTIPENSTSFMWTLRDCVGVFTIPLLKYDSSVFLCCSVKVISWFS